MAHKHAIQAVDRTLRDIMRVDEPFGGKVFVFGGEFRQVLAVVRHGSRLQTVDASLKRSLMWQHLQQLRLVTNMRVERASVDNADLLRQHAEYLLEVGEGRVPCASDDPKRPFAIRLPSHIVSHSDTIVELLEEVYGNDPVRLQDSAFMTGRAIMTPRNSDVDSINEATAEHLSFPGEVRGFSCQRGFNQ